MIILVVGWVVLCNDILCALSHSPTFLLLCCALDLAQLLTAPQWCNNVPSHPEQCYITPQGLHNTILYIRTYHSWQPFAIVWVTCGVASPVWVTCGVCSSVCGITLHTGATSWPHTQASWWMLTYVRTYIHTYYHSMRAYMGECLPHIRT